MKIYIAAESNTHHSKHTKNALHSFFYVADETNHNERKHFLETLKMKLYLAGTTVASSEELYLQELFKKGSKLHSYFHCNSGFETKWFLKNLENGVNLFLDSGAFSAFTKGVTIDIEEYARYIKEIEPFLEVYANLDVIGDPQATWDNQKKMEQMGLAPLPCFHYGEDEKWLLRYLDKYEYVALGGMVPISTSNLLKWLDRIFSEYICDKSGSPRIKVHGFGMTSLPLMLRYPWYSVDSTSWVVTGRLGGIYIPRKRDGCYIYNEQSWKIDVSNRSPSMSEFKEHITTVSPVVKNLFLEYIHEKGYQLGESNFRMEQETYTLKENERWIGKSSGGLRQVETILVPGISNQYKLRDELNIIYFLDLEKSIPEWPWTFNCDHQEQAAGFGL